MSKDNWGGGETYEQYVGRWSRLVAREFVRWLEIAPGAKWLDVGCGTGALSETILQIAQPGAVKGVDLTDDYVAYARGHIADPRASFEVGNAENLPVESASCDVAVSGLVLNFVPDKPKATLEMARAVRQGGMAAAYVWDYADRMQMLRYFWDSAGALNPALDVDEGARFPICKPEPLRALFEEAGLTDVETRSIDVSTVFRDFDDYWTPFLSGQAPAPSYVMSLGEGDRGTLREHIRARLPARPDGSIELVARAWAVRGKVNSDTIKA